MNQVRLDSSLDSRELLIGNIQDEINRIYYVLLAMLADSFVATSSDYWQQFGMTSAAIVLPSTATINNITVPLLNYSILPSTSVTNHWDQLINDNQVTANIAKNST